MKLLSTYIKEMKIAFRGFYFYIEIVIAIIMLMILLLVVDIDPDSKSQEFLYYDIPIEAYELMMNKSINDGTMVKAESAEFKLKPAEFELKNDATGAMETYKYDTEKIVKLEAVQVIDQATGKILKTIYKTDFEEDMIRLSYQTGDMGATISMDDQGNLSYNYMLQGYETDRFKNLLYVIHTASKDQVEVAMDQLVVRQIGTTQDTLNNREGIVPLFVAFAGSLMGFFIIMSYVFLDKAEGVIKAFAVTPSSVWKYLLSKTFVILTTVVISSSVITIPVMGLRPDYWAFYLFLVVTTFGFAALGLFVASFFDTIEKAFGVLYVIMIWFMLPAFSYLISSFAPLWIKFLPTYSVLQGFKTILIGKTDIPYVLTYTVAFAIGGVLLLSLANWKFKKTLTV